VVGGSNPLVPTIFTYIVPLILLTNDDGIEAEGLRCLEESLKDMAEIVVVAPDGERSAVSHGLTIHRSLTVRSLQPNHYALDGTPADCIIHAFRELLGRLPDLVVSGINKGANLADDIMYSGTVAAAREASKHGVPALAVSQAFNEMPIRYLEGAGFVRDLVQMLWQQRIGGPFCFNVNIPVRRIRGVKITRQGCTPHFPHFHNPAGELADDVGREGAEVRKESELMLDYQAVENGYISITPLQRDQTDYVSARTLAREVPRLFKRFRLPGFGLIG
jgi:5'-nucleotidase